MNLFPSNLLPLIAKKISFFFTLELSKEIPEKNILPNSFFPLFEQEKKRF